MCLTTACRLCCVTIATFHPGAPGLFSVFLLGLLLPSLSVLVVSQHLCQKEPDSVGMNQVTTLLHALLTVTCLKGCGGWPQ